MCANTDLLPAFGGEEMTRKFLQEVSNILWAYIHKSNQRNSKVCTFWFQIKYNYTNCSFSVKTINVTNVQQLNYQGKVKEHSSCTATQLYES